jgi:hypothetical protein
MPAGRQKTRAEVDALRPAALAKAAAGEILGPCDMAAIYSMCVSQFCRLNRLGKFDQFKIRPATGPKCFSGALVHRHINGEPVYDATFGKKRLVR